MFDLPVETRENKREYAKFRKKIIKDGFIMMQYSVYSRFCKNKQDAEKHIARIKTISPEEGNIRILYITEKQYEDMILILGTKKVNEEIIGKEYTIVI